MDDVAKLKERLAALETDIKHLSNELSLTRSESEATARNYFDIFSNLDRMVKERTIELERANEQLKSEISDRMAAEQRLRESEKKFRGIIDSTPLGTHIYKVVANGRLVLIGANPAADLILGIRHENLIGRFSEETFLQGSRELNATLSKVVKTGENDHVEIRHHDDRINGIFDIHVFQTSPDHLVVMFMDVTERRRTEDELARYRERLEELVKNRTRELNLANRELANTNQQIAAANNQLAAANELLKIEIHEREQIERALRRSEERYRLFAENFQGLAFRTDLEWRPIFMHGEFNKLTGYTQDDFLFGKIRWTDLIHPKDRPQQKAALDAMRVIEASSTNRSEYRILTKDGRERWVLENIQTVCGSDGHPAFLQGSITDITDSKQAESTLREAKDLAEEANRLKSRFVFNVSHEIRTPLNGIIGFTEIIRESTSLDTIHQQAEIILHESDALLMLVNDLLDHAKIEAGKMDLEIRSIDLFNLLENIMAGTQLQAHTKGLDFSVTVADDAARFFMGDYLRLRQILLNLISNAIKFTHEGYVRLIVKPDSSVACKPGQQALRFEIQDTGIGIASDKQAQIFNSFTQADTSTTRKYGGTGLGTTIARQLVDLMGGKIDLQSKPGVGTTFWFSIPVEVCTEDDQYADFDLPETVLFSGEKNRRRRCAILLAEDYRTNQEIVRLHVEHAGHEITIVGNGEQAVQLAKQNRYDLILMDLQMPVMDGQEATRLIRTSGGPCAEVPILALTASAEASTSEACLRSGMDDVITKPIRQGSFLASLDKWLDSKTSRATGQFLAVIDDEDSATLQMPESKTPSPVADSDTNRPPASESPFDQNLSDLLWSGFNQTGSFPASTDEPPSSDTNEHGESGEVETPMNLSLAIEEFGGNRDLLETVLAQFFNQAEGQLAALKTAISTNDTELIRQEAHKIKGGAANLTAMALSTVARNLEMAAKQAALDEAGPLIGQLEQEVKRLQAFVNLPGSY